MHTYKRSEPGLFTVGFEQNDGFRAMQDFSSEVAAAAFASWLNGGQRPIALSMRNAPLAGFDDDE